MHTYICQPTNTQKYIHTYGTHIHTYCKCHMLQNTCTDTSQLPYRYIYICTRVFTNPQIHKYIHTYGTHIHAYCDCHMLENACTDTSQLPYKYIYICTHIFKYAHIYLPFHKYTNIFTRMVHIFTHIVTVKCSETHVQIHHIGHTNISKSAQAYLHKH